MKKRIFSLLAALLFTAALAGCSQPPQPAVSSSPEPVSSVVSSEPESSLPAETDSTADETRITFTDTGVEVNGTAASEDSTQAVYIAADIVYYEAGHDFTYGEGGSGDAHEPEEAARHTVVHISRPGRYILQGTLPSGQVAVDLGEDAEDDPNAVVTLVLDNVDITCTVAPAIIFYNVYECGSTEEENATPTPDTTAAGANIILADNSENTVNGAYVARIYDPESVVLNESGTAVEDADKLHKYDGAFYSKMSMNITGETLGNGILNIHAANEGLDSELHLTINGGDIRIDSGNDGINTNEDGVSVTTINGGTLTIFANGATGEGDGIDSNGWLVINGGQVYAQACAISGDAGIDSDMGIHINGGTVFASGNMLDQIAESEQNYAVFDLSGLQTGGSTYTLKNADDETVACGEITNQFSYLIVSAESLTPGEYTLWQDDLQLQGIQSSQANAGPGGFPGGELPEGGFGMVPPDGERPGDVPPESQMIPEGGFPGMVPPDGERPGGFMETGETSSVFTITDGGNYYRILNL